MQRQEQHEAFKLLAIQDGISRLEDFKEALPFGYTVPQARVDKWINRLLAVPKDFSSQRRYINRFKLGADPEFIFVAGSERVDARMMNLHQGLAFGMDNNGRLTEIRPYPSRSAVEVVSSLLLTMRWLAALHPATLKYAWKAGAYLHGDGLGGHVHFGRKRPHRDAEIRALDAVSDELLTIKAYPADEVVRRRAGDNHNQIYGKPGDFRMQMHGYEYRTFPSWLDSPELAYLILVLSKLAVHNPKLFQGFPKFEQQWKYYQRLKNVLSYYKDVDDDARLALIMVSKQFPVHLGGDFKARWGIRAYPAPDGKFIPMSIKPDLDTVKEVFEHLSANTGLIRNPCRTWTPNDPPYGYQSMLLSTQTYSAKGLGELVWDMVCPSALPFGFFNARHGLAGGMFFSIPRTLANLLPETWMKTCQHKISVHDGREYANHILTSEQKRTAANYVEARRLLLETVFPFWKINDVKPDSYKQWKEQVGRKTPVKSEFDDKLIFGEAKNLPLPELR